MPEASKSTLNIDVTRDYRFTGMFYDLGNKAMMQIKYDNGKYKMYIKESYDERWVSNGEETLQTAIGMTTVYATEDNTELKINGKKVSYDEFRRTIINVEIKNKLPLIQLAEINKIGDADWNTINQIIKDDYVDKQEYQVLQKIITKYGDPFPKGRN